MAYLNWNRRVSRCNRCQGWVRNQWPAKSKHDQGHHAAERTARARRLP